MAVQSDVKKIIDGQKMTFLQYSTIMICFLMIMLDGMDVLVIAFSASSISEEWSISSEALGIVFSAALVGMTIGALLIAPQADKMGRKAMILVCTILLGSGIYATSLAQSVNQLMLLRFISGLGIGGMLASASTLASEYAPDKSKDFWVSMVMSGYPVGAVLSGLVASEIIPHYGWRVMFQFAGIVTLLTIPLILFFGAESLEYLVKSKPKNALKRVNRILAKMKAVPLQTLPAVDNSANKTSVARLFAGKFLGPTLFLWLAFFMSFATLYFLISWIPKLTTIAGMPERFGIYSGTVFNLGSFVGILVLGGLAIRLGLRRSIFVFMSAAAVLMITFGNFTGSFVVLVMFGLIGFTMQGGFVGLYPVAARIYPAEFRTTGVGWAIGAGRFGAIIGPIVAGYLIGAGFSMTTNFIIFAIPTIVAGLAALQIKSDEVS